MYDSGHLLPWEGQPGQVSAPQLAHWRTALKAPGEYTSWRGWLAGKALPLTFFTLLAVFSSMTLPREMASLARDGIGLYPVQELLRRFLILGFQLLIAAAYLTRTRAVAPARGFRETVFPLLVMFAAPAGLSFLGRGEVPHRLELLGGGLLITLLGYGVSLWALWHLRRSFAIMAEARQPVTSGPYRYVRHPLYLGEALTVLGLCLMLGITSALLFWAAVTAMQLVRARIEEAKLARQFDDYRAYREQTRFILPGIY